MMKKSSPPPSYVDPSSLSLPSPASDVSSPPHLASTSSADTPVSANPSTSTTQPPRKRPRTETSPEEKREARAHRNRIAAQNSRDRRKVQFAQLEESVRLLKQENEQLRAELQREREQRNNAEKDKENAELKERVKSLEQGWEAVVKALQTQGLPSSFFTSKSPSSPSPEPKPDPPTTTFPVFIETPVAFPPTPLSVASPSMVHNQPASNDGSVRHLAADGSIHSPALSTLDLDAPFILLQEAFNDNHASSENRIEHWFTQMLSTDNSSSSNDSFSASSACSLPTLGHDKESQRCRAEASPSTSPSLIPLNLPSESMSGESLDLGLKGDIEMAMEMDELFDLLPDTVNEPTVNSEEFRDLLASVLDESTVVESSGDLSDWSLGLKPHTTDPEAVSASLVVV